MKTKPTILYSSLLAAGTLAVSTLPAQAATFTLDPASLSGQCSFVSTCTVNTITLSSNAPFALYEKTVNGFAGIGILNPTQPNSDPSGGEIDIGEVLTASFNPAVVTQLALAFLYRPGIFGDEVFEIGGLTPFNSSVQGTLTVLNQNQAVWRFGSLAPQTITATSPSTFQGGGYYAITNPFGSLAISGFSLTPVANQTPAGTTPTGIQNSDLALGTLSIQTTSTPQTIPEPATISGLLGLGAIATLTRRRRQKAMA